MRLIVLADELQKAELLATVQPGASIAWINDVNEFARNTDADVFIDLQFTNDASRINLLHTLDKPIIIHSVADTVRELRINAVRVNAWPGFLQSEWIEAYAGDEHKQISADAFALLNKKLQWLPDDAGFVSARVISMIINEAYLALEEGVSTKEEIDTAMKLGTNYPYGPFEWSRKIGLDNVVTLLQRLSKEHQRYTPAGLLTKEVNNTI